METVQEQTIQAQVQEQTTQVQVQEQTTQVQEQTTQVQEQTTQVQDSDKYTKIDHLDEDEPIKGQHWALLSFISPEGIMNCSVRGVKVRGVYATEEAARNAAAKFKHTDKYFDVFVGEVGKWLPWDPNPMDIPEAIYNKKKQTSIMQGLHKRNEEKMNELVGRRKEMLDKSKETHKQRVSQSIKDSAKEQHVNETKSKNHSAQDMRERLQRLHQEKNKSAATTSSQATAATATTTSSQVLDSNSQTASVEQLEVKEDKDYDVDAMTRKAKEVDASLEKLKDLYNKMQNKKQ